MLSCYTWSSLSIKMDVALQIGIGIVGGLLTAVVLRVFGHVFELVPRRLHDVGIGSSFEQFFSRGAGEGYTDVLWLRLHNHSAAPLYIVRAVYLPRRTGVPVYRDAMRSQKYKAGYEVKFGPQWNEMSHLLMPHEDTGSYVPLSSDYNPADFPQGQRGQLLIEYVHDGNTGIHRAEL